MTMPRYIDADALIKRFNEIADNPWNANTYTTWSKGYEAAIDEVDDFPTADVVERKKAYIVNPNPYGPCSECGFLMDIRDKFNFCPNSEHQCERRQRMLKRLIDRIKHHRFCKRNHWYCPDCIYHDFVFDGAIFRGNRCRWGKEAEDE